MTIIICLDKNNGYQFGGKRQSTDRELRKKILELADEIRCDEYTASQFEDDEKSKLYVGDDYLNTINGTCFIEKGDVSNISYDKLVVFWWNRAYPTTKKFIIPKDFKSVTKENFKGFSHDKITMEIFTR